MEERRNGVEGGEGSEGSGAEGADGGEPDKVAHERRVARRERSGGGEPVLHTHELRLRRRCRHEQRVYLHPQPPRNVCAGGGGAADARELQVEGGCQRGECAQERVWRRWLRCGAQHEQEAMQ